MPSTPFAGHALRRSRSHAHAYSGVGMPPGSGKKPSMSDAVPAQGLFACQRPEKAYSK